MDKKNKIFFLVLFLLIAGSVAATYWRIMVKKDYIIEAQADCDPETEKCFVWQCDSESSVEGEACTGDLETDVWYYKIVRRNAKNIPLCDPNTDENPPAGEAGCQALVCGENEEDCEETLCDEETKIEQEAECNDPEQYLLDNPAEEEEGDLSADGEECEEEDAECGVENAKECDPMVDQNCESSDSENSE